MPLTEENVMYFISFLDVQGHTPNVIASHLSALAYEHKVKNLDDHTQSFKVRKMLTGCRKLNPQKLDSRKPITRIILSKLCDALPALFDSTYTCRLYTAAFCLAFYAFLRIGELTMSNNQQANVLQFGDITTSGKSENQPSRVHIVFHKYKHSDGSGHQITIQSEQLVQALAGYEKIRGTTPGPYLIDQCGNPITRNRFASVLTLTLKYCGYDPKSFNTHSFRIGAASHAAQSGMSDAQIQHMGRWKSQAFLQYIRQVVAIFH